MGRKLTEADAIAYLDSIQKFSKKNHEVLLQIMELRAVVENCTAKTDKEPIQSSGDGDKMASLVGRIVDLEREICQRQKIIEHRRAEVEEIAKSMDNERQREYLMIRYVEGNGFYDTVMLMDLSDSTAKRVSKKSVAEFTKRYNAKHNI